MIEVIVVGEGQTEETFVRDVLAPRLSDREISLQPRLIKTSPGGRGGALSKQRVLGFLRNTLRERGRTYVTTFFDLYGLRPDFPGIDEARHKKDPREKSEVVERILADAVVEASGCRAERFLPYIQPHEFEALLFSDVVAFGAVKSEWRRFVGELQRVRDDTETPEHINDGPDTHPSARLTKLLYPRYAKPLHGSRVAATIGLDRIRAECRHFDGWLSGLESLRPLK